MVKIAMMMRTVLLACAVAAFSANVHAQAQSFPSRPVRVLVPFGPGSGADIVTRFVADGLGVQLKQPVLVENRDVGGNPGGANSAACTG